MTASSVLQDWIRTELYDLVPSAVAVIDRDYRIVEANSTFEELFGEWEGRRCYEVYKGQKRKCSRCTAAKTFKDGKVRTHHEVGMDRKGKEAHYVVHAAPVQKSDGTIPYVVEMSTDVTRQSALKEELHLEHHFNRAFIDISWDAIVALDNRGKVRLWNPAATELFGYELEDVKGRNPPPGVLPDEFADAEESGLVHCVVPETTVTRKDGKSLPVRFCGVLPRHKGRPLGSAAFFQDLREVKHLEGEKLEAERLAAVGQTVAGLAHGVKNILTGIEGGLYLMRSGLQKGKNDRVQDGFSMLERNIDRVSHFVRTLLDFSRGREVEVERLDPTVIAHETVALFSEAAAARGVKVAVERKGNVEPAPFDAEGIHTCLANLVTNAIDACCMSERKKSEVVVRIFEEPDDYPFRNPPEMPPTRIVMEVADNGIGLDYEVKQKVFTNFFTTKGEGGTGLGLLVTRKIVQEHGGSIVVESEKGKGTVFRMVFPRRRLPAVMGSREDGPSGPEEK